MNEYFALVFPIIFGIILIVFFSKKVTWWEMLLPTVVGLVVIFSMKSCDQSSNVSDTEYLSQHVVKAVYEERWNEWIKKTCSSTYACGTETYSTGSGKNRHTSTRTKYCTRYYDCSYCETHPPKWYIVDDAGASYSITQTEYNTLTKKWGNEAFVEMNRHFYTLDGNEYVTNWNLEKNTLITTHRTHSYENRVQSSHSIYNFQEVTDSERVQNFLFEYPSIIYGYAQNPIMSHGVPVTTREQDYANSINGLLGAKKQIQYFVCIWKNKPMSVSNLQQAYWKGGNKNELVVCIGLDNSNNVSWVNVFTWSEKDIVRIKIRDYLLNKKGEKLDLNSLTDFAYNVIDKGWQRKNFHDFDFLEIELTDSQINWIYIIVILFSLGLSIFAVLNEIDPNYQTTQFEIESKNKFQAWSRKVSEKLKLMKYNARNRYRKIKKYTRENVNRLTTRLFRKR